MPEIGYADAKKSFHRIREELMQEATAQGWGIGFSIGVAVFPSAPSNIDDALKIADHLMYQVKKAGKNNVIYEEQNSVGKKE